MPLDETVLGLPLPHPDNDPRDVDVPRLRSALTMIDGLVGALQTEKATPADITAAIEALKAGAPVAYDTLLEIAAKLTDNDGVVGGILTTLGLKANAADVTVALPASGAIAAGDPVAINGDETVSKVTTGSQRFFGLAASSQTDGQTGIITVPGGVNKAQSGLTTGEKYYLAANGSISTTYSAVMIGKALSATSMLVSPVSFGTMTGRDFTVSTLDPSGGANGDIWFKVA